MNKPRIPTILGVLVLLIGVAAGVYLMQRQQVFRLGASPDKTPKDVRITNISEDSYTVSWVTDSETVGSLEWGEEPKMGKVATPETAIQENMHTITLRNLAPDKTYYFRINSGGELYTNNGIPWSVKTGPVLPKPTASYFISGSILLPNGQPGEGILVFVSGGGISPLSTKSSASGEWIIPISNARTQAVSEYAELSEDALLEIYAQGGPMGVSVAEVYLYSTNPTPPMTLGNVHDFKNQSRDNRGGSPSANIELPDSETEDQKEASSDRKPGFEIVPVDKSTAEDQVTLESIEEGEVIFTDIPEFFGSGPEGDTLIITVESDPITDQVQVAAGGSWNWSPPKNLADGVHTVTLQWRDATGFLRTLTRTFVVSAAEGDPAFISSPSSSTQSPTPQPTTTATPTATPRATATPTPQPTTTATPTATASSTPSATPRISMPATDSAIPDSGYGAYTILFGLAGLLLVSGGVYLSKK